MNPTSHGASAAPATRIDLGGAWTLRAVRGPVPEALAQTLTDGIPGHVPGVVHLDLLAADLIPDPYDGRNEAALAWIGHVDWEYRRAFDWTPDGHARHELVAEGLDTVATLWLGDTEVGRTANHHRSYRFDVHRELREGRNELRVLFTSAQRYAAEREAVLGKRPHSNPHPFNAIRKPAYAFGWDWGPEIVTAGIWRPIALEGRSGPRLADVRPLTAWSADAGASLDLHVAVEHHAPGHTVRVRVGDHLDHTVDASGDNRLELAVPGADPWWPRTHGDQPLHAATVTLHSPAGEIVDEWRGRLGFRTVEVDTSPDLEGNRFVVRVNGVDVYVRGANWIPDDTYLPRITRSSLEASVRDAVDAGMNLLRVWGGGIYESDDFYDLCDEHGLLVWQDFPLACAAYSEDAELWDEFDAEAREAVGRLAGRASLALFNGGNENIWGWADWGWRAMLDGATWGEGYYTELFPRVVAELAPGVPYLEGSPFSFDRYLHPNDDTSGCMHIWDVWNTHDYLHYRSYRPRFVAEFGFQGPPAFATLESVVHDEPRSPFGPDLLVHQKADDGQGKLQRGLGDHLPEPADYVDWHWATQLNQARAVRLGIEHFRSLAPFNTGAVVWQLNDCWPVVSWAAVDAHRIRKPLWYALRDVFADRLATIQPRPDGPELVLHNDSPDDWDATLWARRSGLGGLVLAEDRRSVSVPARSVVTVPLPRDVLAVEDPAAEFVVADLSTGERALWYFAEDTSLALSDEVLDVRVEPASGGVRVVATARGLVKDLTLLVDHVDPRARVDRALVTLLAGETAEFHVTTGATVEPEAFGRRPVLRSANDLVAAARRSREDFAPGIGALPQEDAVAVRLEP